MKIKLYMCGGEKFSRLSQNQIGLAYLKSNSTDADVEIVEDSSDLKDCDLIGLNATALGLKEAVSILESTSIPVAIGGQGTLWPGLYDYPFKHIVLGEGERSFQKIIDGTNERILKEPLIEDLDTLNFPDLGKCEGVVPMFPSRGCPFKCAYCSSSAFWTRSRFHSAKYFIEEVKHISSKYPDAKGLYLVDDLFIANLDRFNKIHEMWMRLNLHKRFSLAGYVRATLFTEPIAKMMKEMGFVNARFGAESGSDRVLKILGKNATVEDNQRTIDIANKVGLPITAAFIYGVPGETDEERKMTIDFILKNKDKCGKGGWYKFVAFPGTKFYNGENPITTDMNFRGSKDPRDA